MRKNRSPLFLLTSILFALIQFRSEFAYAQSSYEFFKQEGKTGLKDQTGSVTIPAIYEQLGWSKGLDLPVDNVVGYYNNGWGLISTKNRVITSPRYYSLEAQHKNLIIASVKGRFSNELFYGALNSKGEVVIDFKYHSLTPVQNLIIVSERKKDKSNYGLLDRNGKQLLPTSFKRISYFKDDLFVFTSANNRRGVISKNGTVKIQSTLDSIAPSAPDHSLIYESGKVGAIDTAGIVIHKPLYKSITSLEEVMAFKRFKLITASNKVLKEFYCDSIYEISPDHIVVVRNNFYEILNHEYAPIYRGAYLTELSAFRKNIIFRKDGKYHIIKYNGDHVRVGGFEAIQKDKNYIYGKSSGQWFVFNKFGSDVSDRGFDSLIVASNNLIPVQIKGYWGYIDHSGRMAIQAKFDKAGIFEGSIAEVNYLGSNKIINQFGQFIGASEYDKVVIGKTNTALVTKKGRTDLINHRSEILFQTFNDLKIHFFGYIESTADGRVGLISHLGEVILHPLYDSISGPQNRRYLIVKQDNKVGLVNFKGFWILPLSDETQDICHVSEGLISIKKNGQYGFVDFGKKLLIANRYEKTKPFTPDLAAVKLNNKWGFIDKKENLIIQPNYSSVTPFSHGISKVKRDQKYGAISEDGKVKISIAYDSLYATSHDFILGIKQGKYGLFNQLGEQLLQPLYSEIRPTRDNHYIVVRRGLSGLIDASGAYSIPLKYYHIAEFSKGRYACLVTMPEILE